MALPLVQLLIEKTVHHLPPNGLFILYGPFNYHGRYTSDSNERFDAFLRSRDPEQGIRDFEAINTLAEQAGLSLEQDRKSTRLNSSHVAISYAVFCLKKHNTAVKPWCKRYYDI